MCGICGCAAGPDAESIVRAMLARLAHRGPGDRGVVEKDGVALGIARLHVVAPSAPSGPYVTADGAVAAVVNGEIWNHAELRADLEARGIVVPDGADTAVVAPLYASDGIAGFARLRGMFAIGIHDRRDGTIVLARDRFGIKPLHYAESDADSTWWVASEAGALGACANMRDGARAADYLALGVVPAPLTFALVANQVGPGRAVQIRGRHVSEQRFAAPPCVDPTATLDVAELRSTLERAVRRHVVGDLPIGVFLSGGVDSSALAALVKAAGGTPRLFALTFPGEGAYDEGPAARAAAAHLGLPLVEATLTPADVPELLTAIVRAHGGPFADASALATHALCRRAAQDVGVVLSGTGADELFAGYRRYRLGRLSPAALAAARVAGRLLPTSRRTRLGTLGALARKAARAGFDDDASRYLETIAVVPESWRNRLLGRDEPPTAYFKFRDAFAASATWADGARAADYAVYLPDDVLAKEDRAAAAVSMENRVPFLDDGVADLAGRVPAARHLRCGGLRGAKASLRAAVSDLLPREIRDREKRGFGVPISEWMRGPLRTFVDDHLADPSARHRDFVEPAAVADLVTAHRRGDDDLGAAVWALVVLEASLRAR